MEPLYYQWYQGIRGDISHPIQNATFVDYPTPPLTNPVCYWVNVSNALGETASQTALLSSILPPRLQTVTSAPGKLKLNLAGPPGSWWEIQYSEDMITWQPLYTVDWVFLENGQTSVQLPIHLKGHAFFRVMLSP
jgi:hypothetical protein